ncbi:MAG: TIGR02678 family protein [Actinobacteria bacterium]|nr:TIGR02678 family protein [Actinomycetota bacterium]
MTVDRPHEEIDGQGEVLVHAEPTEVSSEDAGARGRPRSRRAWSIEAGAEVAAVLRLLAARPWLVAGRDDEAIAAVRRNADAVRDTFARLGWVLVVERDLVRLRKSPPPRRDAWAATAPSAATCSWFFLLVAAAESMPPKVALATLVTAARSAAAEVGLPVTTDIGERRAISGALKMLGERGVVEQVDGEVDGFVHDENAPVLLAVHHTRLVHVVANFADADPVEEPLEWLAMVEREPDVARRMRRRLVDDTLVHAGDLDPAEADWLRRRVRGDDGAPLAAAFGLHLERRGEGAAFVVPSEAFRHAKELGPLPFPTPGTVGHAALLLCDDAAVSGDLDEGRPGWRGLARRSVVARLTRWGEQFGAGRGGWAGEDVDNPEGLADKVGALLAGLDLVRVTDDGTWWFSPATGRWRAPATSHAAQAAAGDGRTGSAPRRRVRAPATAAVLALDAEDLSAAPGAAAASRKDRPL